MPPIRRRAVYAHKGQRPNFYTSYLPALPQDLSEEYRKFNESLSPDQRAALGLGNPKDNPTGEVRPICRDATPTPLDADQEADFNSTNLFSEALIHNDPEPEDPAAPNSNPTRLNLVVVLEVIRRLLSIYEAASDRKTRLHGEVIALALGVPGAGSVADLARKYGCSRQSVSGRLVRVVEALDLPPTWRMAQAKARLPLEDISRRAKAAREKGRPNPTA